jgi:hypothetical protein
MDVHGNESTWIFNFSLYKAYKTSLKFVLLVLPMSQMDDGLCATDKKSLKGGTS